MKEEAAARQQQPETAAAAVAWGCEMREGKRDCTKVPTPCLHCKTPCNIPASELLLDEALLLNEIAGATKKKDVPLCGA